VEQVTQIPALAELWQCRSTASKGRDDLETELRDLRIVLEYEVGNGVMKVEIESLTKILMKTTSKSREKVDKLRRTSTGKPIPGQMMGTT